MATIAERLIEAHKRIANAAALNHRPMNSITLMAVSKTKPAAMVQEAYAAGARHFGENYLQEGIEKIQQLPELTEAKWHFIGPIQSNKSRPIAEHFDWVHTIDRIKIAQRLSAQRPAHCPPLNVCIQVNISQEMSKSGISPEQLLPLAEAISALPQLRLRGLMAIPAATEDSHQQRASFAALRQLFDTLQRHFPSLDTLSMGMSDDMEAAIAEGSTMVRIGSAIFGSRI